MTKPIAFFTSVLCLCLSGLFCPAQDKAKHTFGKVSPADFKLPAKSIIDSSASAVILSDEGDVHFIGNNKGWFSHVYRRQTKIKILDKRAFTLATLTIPLYGVKDDDDEKLGNVEAIASNVENGQVIQTRLSEKDIFLTRTDKYWTEARFSVPGVKVGSIIEYAYTITSDYNFNLPSWEFQWEDYPCLYSEYQVDIPQTLFYVLVRQGVHPYAVDKGTTGRTSYKVTDRDDLHTLGAVDHDMLVSVNTVKHTWAMKDIPAFGSEQYLTTPMNYLDKISFQESGSYNGEDSTSHMNTWAKATEELLSDERFGGVLDNNSWVDDLADKIGTGQTDAPAMARAVYYYVSAHFACTDHWGIYARTGMRDVIRNNSGTVAEINLLLTALLRKKGFTADPVLLSTRENGFSMVSYPMLDKFNYVVTRLKLNGKIYYLDAAHPQLGFGKLATDCYNGFARIISNTDSGSVYFEADSLKETKLTLALVTNTEKGLEGSWQSTLGPQQSYELRRDVGKNGKDQFFKDIQTRYGDDAEISNGGIDSLDRLEDPVKVHYEFLLRQPPGASVIYLNPIMGDWWRENPFQAAERKYPVEMDYAIDNTYVFSMEIPDGYTIDELPKSTRVAFNGDQGYFEYIIVAQGGRVDMRCRVQLRKAWFAPEDYSSLRDFFGYVVKKENEQIVLKKK